MKQEQFGLICSEKRGVSFSFWPYKLLVSSISQLQALSQTVRIKLQYKTCWKLTGYSKPASGNVFPNSTPELMLC